MATAGRPAKRTAKPAPLDAISLLKADHKIVGGSSISTRVVTGNSVVRQRCRTAPSIWAPPVGPADASPSGRSTLIHTGEAGDSAFHHPFVVNASGYERADERCNPEQRYRRREAPMPPPCMR